VLPPVTVEERQDSGEPSFTETVDVSDYATYSVGVYRVSGTAILNDGTRCTGAALVNVTGRNPVTTVAGGAATGGLAVATVGAAVAGVAAATGRPAPISPIQGMVEDAFREQDQARREEEARRRAAEEPAIERGLANAFWAGHVFFGCLCFAALALIMTPLLALTGGGAAPGGSGPTGPQQPAPTGGQPRRLPRAPLGARITLVGIVSGLLAGISALVLLQQFAVLYPTIMHLIVLLIVGAVAYGVVLPTIGYTIGWWRVNRRVDELERSIGWR
jgi:hypothetical protein